MELVTEQPEGPWWMIATSRIPANWLKPQSERQVLDWEKHRAHPFSVPHSDFSAKSFNDPM
jgi:hypothetical protein